MAGKDVSRTGWMGRCLAYVAVLLGLAGASPPARAADAVAAPTVETIDARDMHWRVLRWGPRDGVGVLLLHGFPQDADSWRPVASTLAAAGYNVVAFDQRGASAATLSRPGDYVFDNFMADALAVADATGLRRFHVVGFGWGGAMAWMLAAYHPDRVRSMTTLRYPHPAAFVDGIEHDPEQRASWEAVRKEIGPDNIDKRAAALLADDAIGLRAFLRKSGLPEDATDRYVARLSQPGVLVGGLSWGTALVPAQFAAVPPVRVPALFVWSKGPAVSESTVQASARYAKGRYRVVELQDVGHFMIETAPQTVAAPILDFLRETDAPPAARK
ncbi:alpha/beta hydrolase [Rhizorhabdus wittichii]|uniref:Alpha/beta hydrolase n=1 Tax=Rhizorhabdus wittichii TaxID=160791 RepID=A0A975HFZ3_9SPHN|nr:alpha/beta hydrolase [Rhizorhabdus wittichii]QTH23907.1 alpha/beta hydrolase [Rhizorhabdus wittichii]